MREIIWGLELTDYEIRHTVGRIPDDNRRNIDGGGNCGILIEMTEAEKVNP
jgi:hypothetical protein